VFQFEYVAAITGDVSHQSDKARDSPDTTIQPLGQCLPLLAHIKGFSLYADRSGYAHFNPR